MKRGAIKILGRHADERHLRWLAWRCEGYTARQIGDAEGYSQEHVRVATNRIKEADIYQSGEPHDIVKEAYW